MMRFTCVLHENTMYFSEKTALFAVFLYDFDANVATSSECANDAFYMCIT